jgi:hypothetical protein
VNIFFDVTLNDFSFCLKASANAWHWIVCTVAHWIQWVDTCACMHCDMSLLISDVVHEYTE